VFDAAADGQDG
jgi:hypothetical protein